MEEAISIIFVIIFRKLAGSNQPVRLVRSQLRLATDQRKTRLIFLHREPKICTCIIIICGAAQAGSLGG
ncbi:hypothetical protein SAMN05216299_10649 [Nitrosospira sp. Nsp14]|nr:hypothetical protein SAMN05216299_10649 [Nitrosospira sp. Nsp14]